MLRQVVTWTDVTCYVELVVLTCKDVACHFAWPCQQEMDFHPRIKVR